jgi:transcriptional regulator with XRE-family HTH domain
MIELGAQLRHGRGGASLTLRDLGAAVGLSGAWISRIERGLASDVGIVQLSALMAVVGLDLSERAYPFGSPLRDAAHLALLERLRSRTRGFRWETEVPVDRPGDLRAWDAMLRGAGVRIAVEAETRPRDVQTLDRRIQLKVRDSLVERVILLVAATRSNRTVLRELRAALAATYPVPAAAALAALAAGRDPGGNSIIAM